MVRVVTGHKARFLNSKARWRANARACAGGEDLAGPSGLLDGARGQQQEHQTGAQLQTGHDVLLEANYLKLGLLGAAWGCLGLLGAAWGCLGLLRAALA